ncbi:DUF1634 domain-containing protein [Pedobacter antarcticus]|uniref:Membrane protein n=2 Tax=Pedobacter antarcticus TaxID=34086 RepID=A0A081PJ96_9SPHI|nr:DUF1634 domain-containing protein [Pedobacter antarcticus]KEQ30769.1 membrane protein [Pedobacter antarcticus 4BY]SDM42584.1 Uncharacterized membrane protein [Pedobacter antarcticus]SFE92187.1 Uncharacterized membrane protein [Pedobacter antarcticus]
MKAQIKKKLTDYDMQQLIGQVLRVGVILSGTIAGIGGIWYLFQQGSGTPHYGTFTGEPAGFTSLTGIYKGILTGSAAEIIQLGVVILIATPIIRIIFSLFSFILEKDGLYVIITLIVLSVILFSMFGGLKV